MDHDTRPDTQADIKPDADADTRNAPGAPRFGLLLLVCVSTVALLGVLTWVMSAFFPNFPG
jgi:hypothetical protein